MGYYWDKQSGSRTTIIIVYALRNGSLSSKLILGNVFPNSQAQTQEAIAPAIETLVDTTEIREESEPKPPSLI
jgi:hypothetical protein